MARHYGDSALPALKWLMPELYTQFTDVLLELEEPLALSLLAPYLWDKDVAAALSKAAAARPAEFFVKCLTVVLSDSNNPRLVARVHEVIAGADPQQLREWVGANTKALAYVELVLKAQGAPRAALNVLPGVLRSLPWLRSSKVKEPLVLAAPAMTTPFVYCPLGEASGVDGDAERGRWSALLDIVIKYILDFVVSTMPLPSFEDFCLFSSIDSRIREKIAPPLSQVKRDKTQLEAWFKRDDPKQGALRFFLLHGFPYCAHQELDQDRFFDLVIERLGETALPTFLKLLEVQPSHVWVYIIRFDAPEIAPHAARAFLRLKSVRNLAAAWLVKFRRTALMRLIPQALGEPGDKRQEAEHAIVWIVSSTEGGRAALDEVAAEYAVHEARVPLALGQLLDADPLDRYSSKPPKLAAWLNPAALTRPALKSGGVLPDEALKTFLQMLAMSTRDAVYGAIAAAREALTDASLQAFAWDLFSMWLAHGAPPKDSWVLWTLGWLCGEECVAKLTALILIWPGEKASARAMAGLDVLEDIGADAALAGLSRIASKDKFKGLQEGARRRIAAIAQDRGLTQEELADRIAPELDLDERGGLDLDFGARRLRVCFDQFLHPFVRDESGARLKTFPRAKSSDDEGRARQALSQWKALNLEIKELRKSMLERLEAMLASSRRLAPASFMQFFVAHRLMRNLTQRLVWGVYAGEGPLRAAQATFRVCEDLTLAGITDEPFSLDGALQGEQRVGLVHPHEMDRASLAAWQERFADYEIGQPIAQLGRETYTLSEEEKGSSSIARFEGLSVDPGRAFGVVSQGWSLGEAYDGFIDSIEKKIHLGSSLVRVRLNFASGFLCAGAQSSEEIKLGKLTLVGIEGADPGAPLAFGQLSPIEASELLRVPSILAAKGAKQARQ